MKKTLGRLLALKAATGPESQGNMEKKFWMIAAALAATVVFCPFVFDPFQAPKSVAMLIVALGLLLRPGSAAPSLTEVSFGVLFWLLASLKTMDRSQTIIGQQLAPFDGYTAMSIYLGLFVGMARLEVMREEAAEVVAAVSIPVSLYAILQKIGADPFHQFLPTGRVTSTMGSPVYLGAVLAIMAVCASMVTQKRKVLGLSSFFLCLLAMWLTQTRGALLAAIVGMVVATPGMVPPATLLCLMIGSLHPRAFSAVADSGRLETWKIAGRMFRDNPLFGVGPGAFDIAFRKYIGEGFVSTYGNVELQQFHAHNGLLQVLSTSGLIGLAGFSLIWMYMIKEARKCRILAGVLAAYATASFFNPMPHSATALVAIMLGAGATIEARNWRRPWQIIVMVGMALFICARIFVGDFYRAQAIGNRSYQKGLWALEMGRWLNPWEERMSALHIDAILTLVEQVIPEDRGKVAAISLKLAALDAKRHPNDPLAMEVLGKAYWIAYQLKVVANPERTLDFYRKGQELAPTWVPLMEKRAATAYFLGQRNEYVKALGERHKTLTWAQAREKKEKLWASK